MPYIKYQTRPKYDTKVEQILEELRISEKDNPDGVYGETNYVIYKLCLGLALIKSEVGNISYTILQNIVGLLECVKQEIIHKQLQQYESLKEEENGDLSESTILKRIIHSKQNYK
jgi:hypothetical protein